MEPLEDRCLLSIASSPAVVAYAVGGISYVDTYVVGTDGSLKEAVYTNDGGDFVFHWNDLDKPNGIALAGDHPAMVAYAVGGTFYVDTYVLGADGSLKEAVYANDGSGFTFHWNDLGQPGGGGGGGSGPNVFGGTRDNLPVRYRTAVADLLAGNGVPARNAALVHGNGGGNTLSGLDLFYGNLALDTYDWDPLTETLVAV
jgi:hypothetical protein